MFWKRVFLSFPTRLVCKRFFRWDGMRGQGQNIVWAEQGDAAFATAGVWVPQRGRWWDLCTFWDDRKWKGSSTCWGRGGKLHCFCLFSLLFPCKSNKIATVEGKQDTCKQSSRDSHLWRCRQGWSLEQVLMMLWTANVPQTKKLAGFGSQLETLKLLDPSRGKRQAAFVGVAKEWRIRELEPSLKGMKTDNRCPAFALPWWFDFSLTTSTRCEVFCFCHGRSATPKLFMTLSRSAIVWFWHLFDWPMKKSSYIS